MNIYAPSRQQFESLLRIATTSVALPPSFAVPIEACDDEHAFTVIFHVRAAHVHVEAGEQSVTVRGRLAAPDLTAMRVCAFPCSVDPRGLETRRNGELLWVRVPKKRPAADTNEAFVPLRAGAEVAHETAAES